MTTSNPIQIILNDNKTNQQMVGIDIIKSPMKYEILDLLRHDEMNFEEIVENTSKINLSSNTISFILSKTCVKVGKYISLFIFKAIICHKNNRITHESATCILFLS